MTPFFLSKTYHRLLPVIRQLPLHWQVKIAAMGRGYFMQNFVVAPKKIPYIPEDKLSIKMWGIDFRAPLANAAGMFKNGEGYDVVASLGAGAYIGGTSTANSRLGNSKLGIKTPFISLPKAHIAINWLGLPNYGDKILSQKTLTKNKIKGCPIGWSLMKSPDYTEKDGLTQLIESLWLYQDNLQIDFIEINESCPNIKLSGASIIPRLEQIATKFLAQRQRNLPVIVKLPPDLNEDNLEVLVTELVRLNYDGINIGNSSTIYNDVRQYINSTDYPIFDYFTTEFGGGCSGIALKEKSLALGKSAVKIVEKLNPSQEFHVIRTGGIDSATDLEKSRQAGISFNQWYTGFFDNYNEAGENVYANLFALVN